VPRQGKEDESELSCHGFGRELAGGGEKKKRWRVGDEQEDRGENG